MSQVKLGDVAVESRETYKGDKTGMPIVGLEHITPGEVTLSNWDTDTDNTFTKRFRKGDMLFGRRRAYLKKAAQAPFDGICSGDITVIRAKEDCLSPELLPFIIQNDNLFEFAVGKSAGSLSPRVKWDNLKNYTFELPPMEEQRKLAEVLWSINDTLQAYQKLLTETDALVQAQFIEMFEGKGFPRSTIGHECKLKSGFTFSLESEIPEGDILYAKVSDMNLNENQKYMITSKTYVTRETAGNTIIPSGSVIFPKRGAAIATNKKRITTQPICVDLNIMAVTPKHLNIQYVYQYFINLDMATIYNGSSIPQINNKDIAPLEIIVPPQKTQEEFAYFAYRAEQTESALQNAITSLQATKRCILENTLGTRRKE